jgi:hypothetical protein
MFGSVLASHARLTWAGWAFDTGRKRKIEAARKMEGQNLKRFFGRIEEAGFPCLFKMSIIR